MSNAELLDLLRVARGLMFCTCEECVKHSDLIDEVVAAYQNKASAQDSVTDVAGSADPDRLAARGLR